MGKKATAHYSCQSIHRDDIKAVTDALKSEFITRGPIVEEFEKQIADYCGAEYAIAFNSGTSALSAAYFAAQTSEFDHVFTSANTFIGTLTGALSARAKLSFIDVDLKTGNMSLEDLFEKINTPSTRGKEIIVPVHYAGYPVDMKEIDRNIRRPDTVIIEDAAHALGSSYHSGSKVGSCEYSDMTVFSFHATKTITTGEGGMVTTNNPELAQRLKSYRNNGISQYTSESPTGNFHLTEIQAALGLSQLSRLETISDKKRKLVNEYRKLLDGVEGIQFLENYEAYVTYHLFPVLIDFEKMNETKSQLMAALKEEEIGSQVHYIPLYQHPVIKKHCRVHAEDFPQMNTYYAQTLSLPLHPALDSKAVKNVTTFLTQWVKEHAAIVESTP